LNETKDIIQAFGKQAQIFKTKIDPKHFYEMCDDRDKKNYMYVKLTR